MAIIKNIEIWFAKLNPARPVLGFDKSKPPGWELQIRTTSKAQRKLLVDMGIKLKPMREDKTDDESPILYYYTNLRKSSINKEGKKSGPVQVVDGKGQDVDPGTIGNGSIANLKIYQYETTYEGKAMIGNQLQGVQLVKHKVFVQKPFEDFDACETEVIEPESEGDAEAEKDVTPSEDETLD